MMKLIKNLIQVCKIIKAKMMILNLMNRKIKYNKLPLFRIIKKLI